jgi:hypothetical protein
LEGNTHDLLRKYPDNCLDGLEANHENLCQYNRCHGPDSNQSPFDKNYKHYRYINPFVPSHFTFFTVQCVPSNSASFHTKEFMNKNSKKYFSVKPGALTLPNRDASNLLHFTGTRYC